MANQSPDRRAILEMMAKAAVASQFGGFSRWVFAAEHQHQMNTPVLPRPAHYQPQFFTGSEYQALEVLTEMMIPADESPGAREAGVSEFIDFMAAHGEKEVQKPMRDGLARLDGRAKGAHGRVFVELSPDQQTEFLREIAQRNAEGHEFFRLVRRYTVMGYYTSRIGLEELDYPGLKLYSQSPACPHTADPEHRHLPPPRF
jgi:hypothetical protein